MLKAFKIEKLRYWAFYDFANSSYVLIYQAFLLPVYFSANLIAFGKTAWGLANGLSTLFGLIFAIIIGSYSDKNNKLKAFKVLIFVSTLGMILISLSVWRLPSAIFYLYIITNAFFIASISLSDSLLTFIADKSKTNEYSGFAWGWGYFGGIVCLSFVMIIQAFIGEYSPFTFLFVGIFYFTFSYYAFIGLKKHSELFNLPETAKSEERKILDTKNKTLLLIGYWLISESITVIILFFSIYATEELKLENKVVGLILLFVQLIGILTTWYGGRLADKSNIEKLLGYSLVGWIIVILLLIFTNNLLGLIAITIVTGIVIGNSQSYLRSQFSQLTRKQESGFQFGLFSIASQAAVIVGPIFHGYLSYLLNSQKIPLGLLIIFLGVGYLLVRFVTKNIRSNELNEMASN